ncbi:SCO1/SenC-domain-containing protein [Lipomyces arxii]|uniref:SCO1/SenC-domain-containing protein n=1 Tax=Lipomyces arxii TaxID=56418 RepID=UPI0034CF0C4F
MSATVMSVMSGRLGLFPRSCIGITRQLIRTVPYNSRVKSHSIIKPFTIGTCSKRYFSISRFVWNNARKGSDDFNTMADDIEATVTKRRRPMGKDMADKDEPVVMKVSKPKRANPLGFFNVSGMILFLVGLYLLLSYRRRVQRALDAFNEENEVKTFGKALIGGPFQLIDQNGNLFTEEDLLRKFSIIYFGFTLCPDICPEELDKLAIIVKNLKAEGIDVQPIFISCDPLRDTPSVVKQYLEEFDIDGIVGLTGSYKDVEACCKAYRVYFSTPPDIKPGEDYIVDHSIFFYLMDPEGEFVNVYGRRYNADEASAEIGKKITKWMPASQRRELSFQKPSFWKFWE